jgi:hypothetical protein
MAGAGIFVRVQDKTYISQLKKASVCITDIGGLTHLPAGQAANNFLSGGWTALSLASVSAACAFFVFLRLQNYYKDDPGPVVIYPSLTCGVWVVCMTWLNVFICK